MKELYKNRREELARRMGNGVAVICNVPAHERTEGVNYPYRVGRLSMASIFILNNPVILIVILLMHGDNT